jgi:hypothetical protein
VTQLHDFGSVDLPVSNAKSKSTVYAKLAGSLEKITGAIGPGQFVDSSDAKPITPNNIHAIMSEWLDQAGKLFSTNEVQDAVQTALGMALNEIAPYKQGTAFVPYEPPVLLSAFQLMLWKLGTVKPINTPTGYVKLYGAVPPSAQFLQQAVPLSGAGIAVPSSYNFFTGGLLNEQTIYTYFGDKAAEGFKHGDGWPTLFEWAQDDGDLATALDNILDYTEEFNQEWLAWIWAIHQQENDLIHSLDTGYGVLTALHELWDLGDTDTNGGFWEAVEAAIRWLDPTGNKGYEWLATANLFEVAMDVFWAIGYPNPELFSTTDDAANVVYDIGYYVFKDGPWYEHPDDYDY